jgi:hypothetical protein
MKGILSVDSFHENRNLLFGIFPAVQLPGYDFPDECTGMKIGSGLTRDGRSFHTFLQRGGGRSLIYKTANSSTNIKKSRKEKKKRKTDCPNDCV